MKATEAVVYFTRCGKMTSSKEVAEKFGIAKVKKFVWKNHEWREEPTKCKNGEVTE